MRAILTCLILLMTGLSAKADPLQVPSVDLFPDGMPGESKALDSAECFCPSEAGVWLSHKRSTAVNTQLLYILEYEDLCQQIVNEATIDTGFDWTYVLGVAMISASVSAGLTIAVMR